MSTYVTVARSNGRIVAVRHIRAITARAAMESLMSKFGNRTDVSVTVR